MSNSPFWQFSLRVYRTEGIPDACIALQDNHGVDVNVLLYLLWLASQGRQLGKGDVAGIIASVDNWRQSVVVPLRTARRFMKVAPANLASPETAALRDRVKAAELEAERLQQEALFAHTPANAIGAACADKRRAANDNLSLYAAALGCDFEPAPTAIIIDAALGQA